MTGPRSPRRALLWTTALGAAALGVGWSWRRLDTSHPVDPAFWELRFERPEGGELAMASLRGRLLVLNFWATWCPPCMDELPDLDRLHRQWSSRGGQVVGLAIDQAAPVRQFLKRSPLSFPVGLAGLEGTELSHRLGNERSALPFTAVFDQDGKLRHRKLGRTRFEELEGWLTELSAP